jgi:hypothetical protein
LQGTPRRAFLFYWSASTKAGSNMPHVCKHLSFQLSAAAGGALFLPGYEPSGSLTFSKIRVVKSAGAP